MKREMLARGIWAGTEPERKAKDAIGWTLQRVSRGAGKWNLERKREKREEKVRTGALPLDELDLHP